MKTIYLDCGMGAAGDMLMGALLELLPDKAVFFQKMNALGLPGIEISAEDAVKCGIHGTHMRIRVYGEEERTHDHPHTHSHDAAEHTGVEHTVEHHHVHVHPHVTLHEIEHRIEHLDLSESVREKALCVYRAIAGAESRVHGEPVNQIHFHEVGTLDALADVVGVCLLFELLAPEQVLCSPVHVGSGQVRCAHGILPVPAPATALLLEGVPIYSGAVRGELCTPTGAALLRQFVTRFGPLPPMCLEKTGYGMGTKDFEAANCMRAMLGQTQDVPEQILELVCNLDDMTPEAVGFAMEQLFSAGALDVYTTPIGMKKCRPAVLLTCMCRESERDALIRQIFLHTTTLGVRIHVCERYTLSRSVRTVSVPGGEIRVKTASGWGVSRSKAEYEDVAAVARSTGQPISEILRKL